MPMGRIVQQLTKPEFPKTEQNTIKQNQQHLSGPLRQTLGAHGAHLTETMPHETASTNEQQCQSFQKQSTKNNNT